MEVPFADAQIKLRLKEDPSEDQQPSTAVASFQGEVVSDRKLGAGNLHFYFIHTRSPDFFLKATLHELGHAAGLDDSYFGDKGDERPSFGLFGTSVMNQPIGPEDSTDNMPRFVTVCDRKVAKEAPTGPNRR